MGQRVVKVSDITGHQADPEAFGQLVIEQHPQYQDGTPVTLDALDDEVKSLFGDSVALVLGSYVASDGTRQRFAVPLERFNDLREDGMGAPMMEGVAAAARERRQAKKAGGPKVKRAQRSRVNYASLEHAGEPHRGRITEEEQRIVREHLDEVNERLREKGMREIDPDDPQMAERYGL